MARKNKIMSDHLKAEIAKELGIYHHVQNDGWGNRTARECGSMVKKAIEIANKNITNTGYRG